MNIAIVTQPIKSNYGGVLQNYALQHVLRQLGHNPITLDYRDSSPLWFYIGQTIKTILLAPFPSKRRKITPYRNVFIRSPLIMDFVHKNITLTKEEMLSYKRSALTKYDIEAIVVGSDQVWRPMYNPGCLYDTFLGFAHGLNIKKLAYAASFGVDNWEFTLEQTKRCGELVRDFDAVSVREASGKELCKSYLSVDAVEVLDPTLLLNADDYKAVCSQVPTAKNDYLCAYILDWNEEKLSVVKTFAKSLCCELKLFSAHTQLELSVEEWLAMFRDAKFVITDSFHGSVFSIIFHKPFYSLVNSDRGASRFHSLLGKFGLSSRIITSLPEKENPNINWSDVEAKRIQWKTISIDYINQHLTVK